LAKVIHPIRSRCLLIRIPAPNEKEIVNVLKLIGERESIEIPDRLAKRIALKCDGNFKEYFLLYNRKFKRCNLNFIVSQNRQIPVHG